VKVVDDPVAMVILSSVESCSKEMLDFIGRELIEAITCVSNK